MLIQFGEAFSDYMYEVFVAKFDFWLMFGLAAQLILREPLPGAVDFLGARRKERHPVRVLVPVDRRRPDDPA